MSFKLLAEPLPIDPWLKLMSSTMGRDKLYRFVQYLCRLLYGISLRLNQKGVTSAKLLLLSSSVGLGRKLWRIGKPLDHLQVFLRAQSIENDVIRTGSMLKALGYGCWLTLDTLQWLHSVKVLEIESIGWINYWAPRCWTIGLLASLSTNLYSLNNPSKEDS